MTVPHIRLDRRQFYLFEGLGINSPSGDPIERILDQRVERTRFLDVNAQLSASVLQTN